MTSRSWDYIAVGGIVAAVVFLVAVVRPLLNLSWAGSLLSLSLLFLIALATPIFVGGVFGVLSLIRAKAGDDLNSSELSAAKSRRARVLGIVFVAILSLVGFTVLLFAVTLLPFHSALADPPPAVAAVSVHTSPHPQTSEELYLDLLKKTLTRAQVANRYERYTIAPNPVNRLTLRMIEPLLHETGYDLVGLRASNPEAYVSAGGDNSARLDDGETMVGLKQLDNVQFCVTDVLSRNVPGDLIEAGAWRGGVTILMRGILKAYGDTERNVWVADSFEGLPPVDPKQDSNYYYAGDMAVSLDEVKENFARYGLLDEHTHFLKGFFSNTLPGAPINKLAALRIDADLYQSTMDALKSLYPKLSVGGYAIFDDYITEPAVKKAVDEYRVTHAITEPIRQIDGQAVYWERER